MSYEENRNSISRREALSLGGRAIAALAAAGPLGVLGRPASTLAHGNIVKKSAIASVPLYYAIGAHPLFGQWWGEKRSFGFEPNFHFICTLAVKELKSLLPAPYKGIHHLTLSGVHVDSGGTQHQLGAAIDIAAVFFKANGGVIVDWYEEGDIVHRRRYLAVEGVWRRWFSFVNNRADPSGEHNNHWHGDTVNAYQQGMPLFSCSVGEPQGCTRSCWWLQEAWNQIWRFARSPAGPAVPVTSAWDGHAYSALLNGVTLANKKGYGPIDVNRSDWWSRYCLATARLGLAAGIYW